MYKKLMALFIAFTLIFSSVPPALASTAPVGVTWGAYAHGYQAGIDSSGNIYVHIGSSSVSYGSNAYIFVYDSTSSFTLANTPTYSNPGTFPADSYFTVVTNGTASHAYSVNYYGIGNVTCGPYITPAIPSVPNGLSVSGSGGSGTLSWSAVAGASSYNVYDGTTLLGSSTSVSYNFTGFGVGNHSLSVSAVNGSGESAKSSSVSYIVLGAPGQVTGLTVSGSGAPSGVLTWTASPVSDQVTNYNVVDNGSTIAQPTTNSYSFSSLTVGTHAFQVSATNSTGTGLLSDILNYSVIPAPSSPSLTLSGATSNSFDANWPNQGTGVTYNVYLDTSPTPLSVLTTLPENTNFYHFSGLASNTVYYVKVVSINASGSTASTVQSIKTLVYTVPLPSAPTGLAVTPNHDGSLALTWSANPSGDSVTSYKVYKNGLFLASVTGTSYTALNLTNGVSYSFAVSAVNSGGESLRSADVIATSTIVSTTSNLFGSLALGVNLKDIFAGIGLFLMSFWPIVVLGIVIPLAFKLGHNLRNLGQGAAKTTDSQQKARSGNSPGTVSRKRGFKGVLKNSFGGGKKYRTQGYYGKKKLHKKKGVKMVRRSTRNLAFGGKRLTRRTMNYSVKRVKTASYKKKQSQKKYGTNKLAYLTKKRPTYNRPKKSNPGSYAHSHLPQKQLNRRKKYGR